MFTQYFFIGLDKEDRTNLFQETVPFSWENAFSAVRQAPLNQKISTIATIIIGYLFHVNMEEAKSLAKLNIKEWKEIILSTSQTADETEKFNDQNLSKDKIVFDFSHASCFRGCNDKPYDELETVDSPMNGNVSMDIYQNFSCSPFSLRSSQNRTIAEGVENEAEITTVKKIIADVDMSKRRFIFSSIGKNGQIALMAAANFSHEYREKHGHLPADGQVQVITLDSKLRHDYIYQGTYGRHLKEKNVFRLQTPFFSDKGDKYPIGQTIQIHPKVLVWQHRKELSLFIGSVILTAAVSYWFAIPVLLFGYRLTKKSTLLPPATSFARALKAQAH